MTDDERTDETRMPPQDWLAERFEAHRGHLRGVAYRMLGSLSEADDAVQEAWIRLSRTNADEVENLRAWLTTVVGRVSLNMLRSRRTRRESSLDARLDAHVPDPIVSPAVGVDPEQEAILGDSVGLALLAVLDALSPPERVAFVLHDVFGVPFDDIARIVDKTPAATRQLASRGRRRVRGAPVPDTDLDGQWAVVDAFLAASRDGDFERLLSLLDPDVVLRTDGGEARPNFVSLVRGAEAVASQAFAFRRFAEGSTRALINGVPGGVAWTPDGRVFAVIAATVARGRIVELDILADPDRLRDLDLTPIAE
ncbi:MAG TPA: sigma-70 family RNA polymerase sigma factor [Candidatus Limnocylindrales bacterium]|nr:sigma-70 family RNA polymerase sigma factor [Candidatus Limnocylindrales bacterium]